LGYKSGRNKTESLESGLGTACRASGTYTATREGEKLPVRGRDNAYSAKQRRFEEKEERRR
jgi:hypothetical protein